MRHIIDRLSKEYEERNKKAVERRLRDRKMIEYSQNRWEYHKALSNTARADFYDWVLELCDRLEESEAKIQGLEQEVEEWNGYVEDNQVEDRTSWNSWYER